MFRFSAWTSSYRLIIRWNLIRECNSAVGRTNSRIINLEKQVDFFVKANLPPSEGLLAAHAHWSGYEFAVQLFQVESRWCGLVSNPYVAQGPERNRHHHPRKLRTLRNRLQNPLRKTPPLSLYLRFFEIISIFSLNVTFWQWWNVYLESRGFLMKKSLLILLMFCSLAFAADYFP